VTGFYAPPANFSPEIFTRNFHPKFSPKIFTQNFHPKFSPSLSNMSDLEDSDSGLAEPALSEYQETSSINPSIAISNRTCIGEYFIVNDTSECLEEAKQYLMKSKTLSVLVIIYLFNETESLRSLVLD
jgi:hypothetical protein